MFRIPRKTLPLAVVALGVTAVLTPTANPAPAAADTQFEAAAAASALWLAGEVEDGALPGPGVGPDWGLTIDALIALEATGADPAAASQVGETVAANVRSYNSHEDWDPESEARIGGATAKILYAAVVSDADPTDFGGFDMRTETLYLMGGPDAGADEGRISDHGTGADNSNTFGQSLGVLGLARSGGVPQEAVDFLIRQQCSEGGFRLSPDQFGTPAPTCDEAESAVLDPDSTGMAVQALLAAAEDGAEDAAEAAELGADWLEEIQREDGAFGGSGPTANSNTNSTGLAGQALAAAGRQVAADDAAAWVLSHQITASSGAASSDAGTIAYNRDSYDSAVADGIPDMQRDQWRRASAQALLGLAQVPLGEISRSDGPGTGPTDPPTVTPTPTTGPTATPPDGQSPPPPPPPPPGDGTEPPGPDAFPTDLGTQPVDPAAVDPGDGPHAGEATDPKKNLAVTGAGLAALVVTALVLTVVGATLFLATRRKVERA